MPDLSTVDPEWAWKPFAPSVQEPWDRRRASHLYRRAAMGATASELDEALKKSPADVVNELCTQTDSPEFTSTIEKLGRSTVASNDARRLTAWWLRRLLHTSTPLVETMTLFWHGHFATSASKVTDPELMYQQNATLRRHALGSFAELVHDVAKDPAMLLWLDSASNRKVHPNENFARELMELFCLGEGNYTEADIRELARCFTGWEVRRGKFRLNPEQQDQGTKSLFGEIGVTSGQDGINIVLKQPATASFIVRKLFRYFIMDEPQPSQQLIEPLVRLFRDTGLSIRPVVQTILSCQLFFSSFAMGRKVRAPVDMAVGLLRCFAGSVNSVRLATELSELGQDLFFPPNVKGWDGGRSWINSSTLLGRSNLLRGVFDDPNTRFAGKGLHEYLSTLGLKTAPEIVAHWEELLFAVPLSAAGRTRAIETIAGAQDREKSLRSALHLLCTLPEFHLS